MYIDYSMKLTDLQKGILSKCIELLKPFDKEDQCNTITYFTIKTEFGDEIGEETCDNEECIKAEIKDIRKNLGKHKRIFTHYQDNNSDHENIDRCSQCYRPLNGSLTWLHWELDYYIKNERARKDITTSHTAFDLIVIFSSMPSNDERITDYQIHQNNTGNSKPLKDQLKRQSNFANRVIRYAKHVIKVLSTEPNALPKPQQ